MYNSCIVFLRNGAKLMVSFITDTYNQISNQLRTYLEENPNMFFVTILIVAFLFIIVILLYIFIAWLSLKLSKKIFRSLERKHGKKIHFQFAENLIKVLIVVLFIIMPLAGDKIRQSILGSAAVITAVIGFAAQDVIKDVLSGFLISIYKPFDLGDRIELEDGTAGIVESITMHHVVLSLVDTVKLVVPNSKLNTSSLINYSYDYVPRSVQFNFPIGYDSDIAKAKEVIAKAVKESPFSVPGKIDKSGEKIYGPVYFISIEASALMMKTTVYYNPDKHTEDVKDDIHTRVFEALQEAGIEVPYPHSVIIAHH